MLVKQGVAGLESYSIIGINVRSERYNNRPDSVKGMRLITSEIEAAIRSID